tara:strand:+ start:1342 stop:1869 length:528 start_codon:yes stop_codon:yes gene_type:complete
MNPTQENKTNLKNNELDYKIYIFDLDNTLYQYLKLNQVNTKSNQLEKVNPTLFKNLNGEKIIFSNANYRHVDMWLNQLTIKDNIDSIISCDIIQGYKPNPLLYLKINNIINMMPQNKTIYFFDDLPINLNPAKELGWITILITRNQSDLNNKYYDSWIDYKFNNINEALTFITTK